MDSLLYAIDWSTAFRPAALALLAGRSPYEVELFYNPPWALLPLVPLALLPEWLGRLLLLMMTFALFAFAAWRFGAKPLALGAFLLSPPVIHSLLNGNLDALVLAGAALPPPVGLFLISVKPQMGAPLAAYWAIAAWRDGGLRRVLTTFMPVTLAMLASFALYGPWPLKASAATSYTWNASLWPLSIPAGLLLMLAAIRQRRAPLALAAGPPLSPYTVFHSWSASLIALAPDTAAMILACAGLWAAIILTPR